jgi:preprotein translocase YajC subunit
MLAAAAKHSSSATFFIILIVAYGLLYWFYFRPRQKKAKAARTTQRKVEVGERAQTIGGFVGTVVHQTDEFVTIRSSSGVELDFIPSAIARRYDPVVPASLDDQPVAEHDDAPTDATDKEEGDSK